MQLSQHFSLAEAIYSKTAIDNKVDNMPDEKQLATMKYTAEQMELVRKLLGEHPIKVNSWFRGPKVNSLVGGVATSQHSKGEAVDFTAPWFGSALEVCKKLMEHKHEINYDQLIYEQTWIHISFVQDKPARKSELTFLGRGRYQKGIA